MQNAAVDVETTGLISGLNEIVQLSIILYHGECPYEITNQLNLYIKPMHLELIDEEALEMNKLSLDFLMKQPTPIQAKNVLFHWLEDVNLKLYPLGHNYAFDQAFLKIFLGDSYDNIFHYKFRDTHIVSQYLIDKKKIKLETTKLVALAEYFSIPHKPHDSLSDCVTTIRIYERLLKL